MDSIKLAARFVMVAALTTFAVSASPSAAIAQNTSAQDANAQDAIAKSKDQLYVSDFAWTNQVTGDRGFDRQFTDTAPIGPITLWTRMVGSAKALDLLRAQNRLPIWHQWYVSCGAEVDFVGASRPIDEVDLRIEGAVILNSLAQEVRSRDFFDWRTWSKKEHVNGCRYTVRIVDNRDTPIYCETLNGDCEITIKLSN